LPSSIRDPPLNPRGACARTNGCELRHAARAQPPSRIIYVVPGLYLIVIIVSFAGVLLLAHRLLPGVVSLRLVRPITAVLVAFLAFDLIGAARGWFASNLDWVVAYVQPGIPPEEPLLLAFLALFSVVLFESFRLLGRRRAGAGSGHGTGAATGDGAADA
jgi:hypothetical protein